MHNKKKVAKVALRLGANINSQNIQVLVPLSKCLMQHGTHNR